MADINKIILIGRIGQEPEIKYFESGAYLTKFTLANKTYNTKTKEDDTNWFNVETFSKLGEYIKKGVLVAIEGKLKSDTWKNDKGENKKRIYVFAENIQILTPKENENIQEEKEEEIAF